MRCFPFLMMVASITAGSARQGEPNQFIGIRSNETSKIRPHPWKSSWNDTADPDPKNVGSWPLTFHPSPFGHRFTVPVHFGDPPQRFDLDVHTGMATTWVIGESSFTEGGWPVASKAHYVPSNSSQRKAHKKGFQNFELSFPDWATVEGTVYRDRVRIGDGDGAIGYWMQEFGVAKTIHPRFVYERNLSGVLGLGPKYDIGKRLPASLLTALGKTDLLWSWKFSVTFKEEGGHMDWGWRNESRYTGELLKFWHSTTTVKKHVPDAHHTIKTSAVYIGKDKLRSRRELTAGIDSTSSYIALPFPMALHYYKKLRKRAARRFQLPDGYEAWHVPCNWNPPDIVVTFSNLTLHDRTDDEKKLFRPPKQHEPEVLKNYTIPGDRLLLREPGTELCLGAVVGRIQKQNSDFLLRQKHRWPEVVLGWPFLKNKFIEIDRVHGIYIAEAA